MGRIVAIALALVVGCGGNDEDAGTAFFTASAGASVESDAPPLVTSDGWTLHFDRFVVAFHDLTVRSGGDPPLVSLLGSRLVDLKVDGTKRIVTFDNLPAGTYGNVAYRIAPAEADAEVGPGATTDDKTLMAAGKYGLYFEGTATNAGVTKYIRWGLGTDTTYACGAVTVNNGAASEIALSVDVTKLFGDFGAFAAADRDGDRIVTLAEVDAAGLGARVSDGAKAMGSCK